MKKKFLSFSMNLIKANNDFDDIKLAELRYGLESFYMLITKMIVSIIISILLNIFKEFMLFLIFYTPLRGFGFGFHANNSKECWAISIPTFILFPYLIKVLVISPIIIQIVIILSMISFLFFAPADTKKKPLINTKKRLINKCIIIIISLIYLFSTLFIQNNLILNALMFTCLWQAICVNPLVYKLFHQSFNNYKNYLIKV